MNRDELRHHGIKGQKWGVRRFQNADGTLTSAGNKRYVNPNNDSDGHEIDFVTKTGAKGKLKMHSQTKLAKFLSKISPSIAEESQKSLIYDMHDDSGKKIGDLQLYKESSTSMNVSWVGVSPKVRGKGYASAVMDKAVQIAKKNGATQVTLEVPGNSPDARHIYEKMGFKATKSISDKDDVWGGLTAMKLKLKR